MSKSEIKIVLLTLGVLIVATRTEAGRDLFQGRKSYF